MHLLLGSSLFLGVSYPFYYIYEWGRGLCEDFTYWLSCFFWSFSLMTLASIWSFCLAKDIRNHISRKRNKMIMAVGNLIGLSKTVIECCFSQITFQFRSVGNDRSPIHKVLWEGLCDLLLVGAVIFKLKFKVNIIGGGAAINPYPPRTFGTCHSPDLQFFLPQYFLSGFCYSRIQGFMAWSQSLSLCLEQCVPQSHVPSQCCLRETWHIPT